MIEENAKNEQIPGASGLFTWPDDNPSLIGGRCKSCKTYFFPKFAAFHRPGCLSGEVEEVYLNRKGRLVSYTILHFAPPPPFVSPDPFVPYAVGLVALPEGIQIPGILTGVNFDDLKINMEVEFVVEKAYEKEGKDILTWKFRPVKSS